MLGAIFLINSVLTINLFEDLYDSLTNDKLRSLTCDIIQDMEKSNPEFYVDNYIISKDKSILISLYSNRLVIKLYDRTYNSKSQTIYYEPNVIWTLLNYDFKKADTLLNYDFEKADQMAEFVANQLKKFIEDDLKERDMFLKEIDIFLKERDVFLKERDVFLKERDVFLKECDMFLNVFADEKCEFLLNKINPKSIEINPKLNENKVKYYENYFTVKFINELTNKKDLSVRITNNVLINCIRRGSTRIFRLKVPYKNILLCYPVICNNRFIQEFINNDKEYLDSCAVSDDLFRNLFVITGSENTFSNYFIKKICKNKLSAESFFDCILSRRVLFDYDFVGLNFHILNSLFKDSNVFKDSSFSKKDNFFKDSLSFEKSPSLKDSPPLKDSPFVKDSPSLKDSPFVKDSPSLKHSPSNFVFLNKFESVSDFKENLYTIHKKFEKEKLDFNKLEEEATLILSIIYNADKNLFINLVQDILKKEVSKSNLHYYINVYLLNLYRRIKSKIGLYIHMYNHALSDKRNIADRLYIAQFKVKIRSYDEIQFKADYAYIKSRAKNINNKFQRDKLRTFNTKMLDIFK